MREYYLRLGTNGGRITCKISRPLHQDPEFGVWNADETWISYSPRPHTLPYNLPHLPKSHLRSLLGGKGRNYHE